MNITVYCGASAGSEPIYEQKASELGQWLAAHDITLVYGGGRTGLMGKLANAVLANGGKAVGVIPEFLKTAEEVHTSLTQLITVDTMSQRKDTMLQMGDAFIAPLAGPARWRKSPKPSRQPAWDATPSPVYCTTSMAATTT